MSVQFQQADANHHRLHIPTEMRDEAASMFREQEVDTSDSRDASQSQQDAMIGKLAELVAQRFFESKGVSVEMADTWQTDLLVGDDNKNIDVKVRDRMQTWGSDLLVRDRETTSLNSDGYLQLILEDGLNTAVITGWATREQVKQSPWFDHAKTHPTRIVEQCDLRDVRSLVGAQSAVTEQSERHGGNQQNN